MTATIIRFVRSPTLTWAPPATTADVIALAALRSRREARMKYDAEDLEWRALVDALRAMRRTERAARELRRRDGRPRNHARSPEGLGSVCGAVSPGRPGLTACLMRVNCPRCASRLLRVADDRGEPLPPKLRKHLLRIVWERSAAT
jgi:hypothetical protein